MILTKEFFMSWWKAANMTVTANSKFITVLSGDNWELLNPTDGLVVGNNAPVEIKQAYFNGTNTIIELVNPWPNSTSNNLTGVAFPTDADLGEISKALSSYLENFTLATNTDALNGTENTRPMTALRVREAMNNRLGDIGLNFKVAKVGFNSFTTPEALVTLFGERVEYSSAIIQFEAPEMYGFVRGFAQSTDSYNYSFQEFTGASDKKYFRTATNATTWTPWREFLLKGDNGFGTTIAGVLTVTASLTPSQIAANGGDFKHYTGIALNHGSYAPTTFGVISGYIGSDNNYSHTYQEFSTLYGEKYHRTAAGANGWNPWRKVLVEGDFGLGVISSPSGVANDTGLNSIISVGVTWANSPYAGTDSRNQGMILTMKHADPTYGIQMFHGLSTKDLYFRNYSAGSFGSWNKAVFQGDYGIGTPVAATGVDFNDYAYRSKSATYFVSGPASANPTASNGWLKVDYVQDGFCRQTFESVDSTSIFIRQQTNSVWTPWKLIKTWEDDGFWQSAKGTPNLNALTANGIYRQENPTSGLAYTSTLHMHSNDGRQQMTIERGGSRMVFRGSPYGSNGSGDGEQYWNGWKEVYHTGNVVGSMKSVLWDTNGACPIIERGSNSNGEYVKFADGTLICWGTPLVIANQLADGNAGTYGWSYYYENNSVLFPAVFTSAPSVQATPQGAFLSACVVSASATAFVVTPVTNVLISAGAPIMYTATGRWR